MPPVQTKRTLLRATVALASCALFAPLAQAQAQAGWPARPIRLVVPFPPGGLIDNMARLVGAKLGQDLGQPVVVDNKPGAGGNLGAAEAARAPADGYTLLMASPALTISPAIYKNLPYQPSQLAPVALLGRVPNVLLVNPASGVTTVSDLVARAKAAPGRMNYASNGNGTSLHLSAELFKRQTGAFITHVPYRGSAAAVTALLSGEVDLMFDNLPSSIGQIKAGKLRALAVTTPQRSAALPQVPTLAESGLEGFNVSAWFGMAAPAGLPAPVVARLSQALQKVVQEPDTVAAIQRQGAEPAFMDAPAAAAAMASDAAQWKQVAAFAKIQLD
ncbi:tripartite tricarboxylate transporter substrate binding protein [Paracidovorax wautersii]|uniref:Tripartite-type tricarboxylate transporter, receptor component TctC n=1 Tax=Paracidovorax wautersii TaxID=1177982 RepID=A0A1I2ED23_9BURK|nr:tripartite tricarboxylate transporter substrate binding protein [Paracidovorax wautersii]SFE90543.1 Tripartite-type tricarboxylate transporter, receptor component TctC [Paracidovorax wautersii]